MRTVLNPSKISIISALVIGLVTLAVFLPALHNSFVNWDDDINLVNNPNFHGFDWIHLKWMWTNRLLGHYIPLTWMSFGLDYVLWNQNKLGYYLTNVLLHAANAVVFFLLAVAIFQRAFPRTDAQREAPLFCGAAFAAFFFSLHPLRVESVAWATERRDVLSGLFYLLALLVYVRAHNGDPKRSRRWLSYMLCLAFYAMAILSKEIAVTLPFVLLLLDVYPLRRLGAQAGWAGREVRSVWLEKIPFFVMGAADGLLALYIGTSSNLIDSSSVLQWTERLSITVYGMAFYLWKTILPIGLSPLYPLTRYKASLLGLPFQLSATVVLLVTMMGISWRRRFPGILTAWVACAITLLPVSGIVHQGFQITADRYTYLACMGWALLAGAAVTWGWRELYRSRTQRALLVGAAVIILFTLSFLARKQIAVWQDSVTLWTQAIAVEPSFTAYLNLGSGLAVEGDALGASEQYRKAIAMWPQNGKGHHNLGSTLLDMRQWDEAAREFRLAIQWQPQPATFNSLGLALEKQGKLDEAIAAFQQGVRLDSSDLDLRRNLQRALRMKAQQQGDASETPR